MLSCIAVEFSFVEENIIEIQLYIDDPLYSKNHDADI
jgi:methylglyoxal synthase